MKVPGSSFWPFSYATSVLHSAVGPPGDSLLKYKSDLPSREKTGMVPSKPFVSVLEQAASAHGTLSNERTETPEMNPGKWGRTQLRFCNCCRNERSAAVCPSDLLCIRESGSIFGVN